MRLLLLVPLVLAVSAVSAAHAAPAASAAEARPLGVGALAPDVTLRTADDEELGLGETVLGKKTVLVFYRGGWCPYCTKHLAELASAEAELLQLGWQVIAISPDAPAALKPSSAKHKLAYRLLSDRHMRAADAFRVAFRVDETTVQKYREYEIELPAVPGEPSARWLPVPSVFLLDATGRVRFVHSDPDYTRRLAADALLAAARSVR